MLRYNIDNDFKFIVQPQINGELADFSQMKNLRLEISGPSHIASFAPLWKMVENGISIEVQKEMVRGFGVYSLSLIYRRPDSSYVDFSQDKKISTPIFEIVPLGAESSEVEQVDINIIALPEYKGEKGDPFKVDETGLLSERDLYDNEEQGFVFFANDTGEMFFKLKSGWSDGILFGKGEKGDPFRFEDFTQEQLDAIQLPITEIAANAISQLTQSAITATSAANQAAETANTAAANVKDGYTPIVGENENWFVNDVDTGKPSRGRIGETIYNVATGTPLRVWLSDTLPEQKETDIIYIGYE